MVPNFSDNSNLKHFTMTMWADNIKFVKDIIDSKYQKIDAAATEVGIVQNLNNDDYNSSPDDRECRGPAEGPLLPEVQGPLQLLRESSGACPDQ